MPGSSGRRRAPPFPRRKSWNRRLPAHNPDSDINWLGHALVHLCDLHLASLSAPPDNHPPDPLRPDSKIAIMTNGKYYTYFPSELSGGHTIPQDIQSHPAPPRVHDYPSGGADSLPYALHALRFDPPSMIDVVHSMFGGYALSLLECSVPAHKISVPRSVIDSDPAGLADSVVRLVHKHEAALCHGVFSGTVPRNPSHAAPPVGRPVLFRGPTAIYCDRDKFGIRHYCMADTGTVDP